MADKIKGAIETFEDYKENEYDLRASNGELFDIAIRSLKAWEEVLNELDKRLRINTNGGCPTYIGDEDILIINIIKQKLE